MRQNSNFCYNCGMSLEIVKQYLKSYNLEDKIKQFLVSLQKLGVLES